MPNSCRSRSPKGKEGFPTTSFCKCRKVSFFFRTLLIQNDVLMDGYRFVTNPLMISGRGFISTPICEIEPDIEKCRRATNLQESEAARFVNVGMNLKSIANR